MDDRGDELGPCAARTHCAATCEVARGNHDVCTLIFEGLCHGGNVLGYVLTVGVNLNGGVIAMAQGILHARLHGGGKAAVHGEIDVVERQLVADAWRCVARAVVDDEVVNVWAGASQLSYGVCETLFLVVRGHDCKDSHDSVPSRLFPKQVPVHGIAACARVMESPTMHKKLPHHTVGEPSPTNPQRGMSWAMN